jgi:hypothetical protein
MRTYRRKDTGELALWFEPGEIDGLMEAALAESGLLPISADSEIDIEDFIEGYLGAALDQHAELDVEVMGCADLGCRPPRIRVNRWVTEESEQKGMWRKPWARARWRSTLAHEAAHVLLHVHLYDRPLDDHPTLFADDGKEAGPPKAAQCLKRDIESTAKADWREWQANQGMAALLMPRSLFLPVAAAAIERLSLHPEELEAGTGGAGRLTAALGERFVVSRQAAGIRLTETRVIASAGQPRLPFEQLR